MPISLLPACMLLAFAAWTVALLVFTIGVYRFNLIFRRGVAINAFPADRVEGSDFYLRSMRAHANCVENLPVFAAIVVALYVTGAVNPTTAYVSVAISVLRVAHSLVHLSFVQTARVVTVRFSLFLLQLAGFCWLIGAALHALP
jgi:uncharacterized MAPEG superfamily protein